MGTVFSHQGDEWLLLSACKVNLAWLGIIQPKSEHALCATPCFLISGTAAAAQAQSFLCSQGPVLDICFP